MGANTSRSPRGGWWHRGRGAAHRAPQPRSRGLRGRAVESTGNVCYERTTEVMPDAQLPPKASDLTKNVGTNLDTNLGTNCLGVNVGTKLGEEYVQGSQDPLTRQLQE